MKEHWNEIKKLLKFGITGVMNTAVDFVVYTVLVSVCSMGLYVSQVISYCCGMLNSYAVNRKWTFDTKNGFFSLELVKFVALNLAMMLLGMGIIYLCHTRGRKAVTGNAERVHQNNQRKPSGTA